MKFDKWFYSLTLIAGVFIVAPSLYWYDSPEFTVAGFSLGISHPTGFPLLMMFLKAAQLIPLGSLSFRSNLLCFLFFLTGFHFLWNSMELALGFVSKKINKIFKIPVFLILLSIPAVMFHAAAAEVYALNILLFSLMLNAFVRFLKEEKQLYMLAFITGVAAGNHILALIEGLALIMYSFWHLIKSHKNDIDYQNQSQFHFFQKIILQLLITFLFFCAGASVVIYLYVRGSVNPFRNWGNPSNLHNFLYHISGKGITSSFSETLSFVNVTRTIDMFKITIAYLWKNMGVLPLFFVFAMFIKRFRFFLIPILLAIIVDFLFTMFVNPMGVTDYQTLSLAMVLLTIGAVPILIVGYEYLLKRLKTKFVANFVVFVLTFAALLGSMPVIAFGSDYSALDTTNQIIKRIKPGAVAVTTSDHFSGLFLYLQGCENRRWDMIHLVAQHVIEDGYMHKLLDIYGKNDFPKQFEEKILELTTHPEQKNSTSVQIGLLKSLLSYWSKSNTIYWEIGIPVYEHALSMIKMKYLIENNTFLSLVKKVIKQNPLIVNDRSAQVLSSFVSLMASKSIKQQKNRQGELFLKTALLLYPDNYRALSNLGTLYSFKNNYKAAYNYTKQALSIKPDYSIALLNESRYCAVLQYSKCFEKAANHYLLTTQSKKWNELYDIAYMSFLINQKNKSHNNLKTR